VISRTPAAPAARRPGGVEEGHEASNGVPGAAARPGSRRALARASRAAGRSRRRPGDRRPRPVERDATARHGRPGDASTTRPATGGRATPGATGRGRGGTSRLREALPSSPGNDNQARFVHDRVVIRGRRGPIQRESGHRRVVHAVASFAARLRTRVCQLGCCHACSSPGRSA